MHFTTCRRHWWRPKRQGTDHSSTVRMHVRAHTHTHSHTEKKYPNKLASHHMQTSSVEAPKGRPRSASMVLLLSVPARAIVKHTQTQIAWCTCTPRLVLLLIFLRRSRLMLLLLRGQARCWRNLWCGTLVNTYFMFEVHYNQCCALYG